MGAPHRRDRWWAVAWPSFGDEEDRRRGERIWSSVLRGVTPFGSHEQMDAEKDAILRGETWSTPRSEGFDAGGGREHSSLSQEARGKTWPTPVAQDSANARNQGHSHAGTTLVNATWPTPQARDFRQGSAQGSDRMERKAEEGWSPNLNDVAAPSGSLNPSWVETLMGYPIGYTLPEGEPLLHLPGEWPTDSPDGRGWMTPKQGDGVFASGSTSGRSREMSTHLTTQVKITQTWPAGLGAPQHEWEPPRLTSVKENRAARLKALGNSIVPRCAMLWLSAIQQEAHREGNSACQRSQVDGVR